MMWGLHLEVLLALAYAGFLVGVAFVLEALARRSQKRTTGYSNSGFIYFRDLDYWECPAGHQLIQISANRERQITYYRAPASACNSCSLKLNCTDSDEGRLLERRTNPWLESELRRFHRGISMTLLFLAALILIGEAFRFPFLKDREALLLLLLPLALMKLKLLPTVSNMRQPT
jgi:hypothetical protein